MIRTQIYIPKETHQKLLELSQDLNTPMAKIIRDFIQNCLAKTPNSHTGINTLRAITHLNLKGGPKDLSANLDKYLYS